MSGAPIREHATGVQIDDGSIAIEFAYHNGDEALPKAKRETSSTAC